MPYEKYRDAFDRDGFVIVRQLLGPTDFVTLTANLDRYIREVIPTLPDKHAFYDVKGRPETLKQMNFMATVDQFFREHMRHPAWLGLAEGLLGEAANPMEPEWFDKPPGTEHPTPAHQDNYYFNLKPPSVLTIWMALDPVDEANGCLRYIPGSHRRGIRPHGRSNVLGFSQGITDYGPADRAAEVCILLQPGDVVVHHGNTIHRADANRSPTRHRRGFAIVYKGVSARRDEEAFARYQASAKAQQESMGLKV